MRDRKKPSNCNGLRLDGSQQAKSEGHQIGRNRQVHMVSSGRMQYRTAFSLFLYPKRRKNFPSTRARLCGTFGEDRTAFLDSLGDYDLLIIDDLGVERNTEYALEQMFSIIDSRYRCNKPLIVTTNLKLDELKHPPDLAHARIYDRILERCAPILFAGKNFREDTAASTKAAARQAGLPHEVTA